MKRAPSPPPLLPGWKRALLAIPRGFEGRLSALAVGFALESRADRSGRAYPSAAQIMADASLSIRSVRRGLAGLRRLGFIVDTGDRVGHTKQIVVWQLASPSRQSELELEPELATHRKGASRWHSYNAERVPTVGRERVPTLVHKGASRWHPEAQEVSIEPKPAAAQRAAAPDVISTRPPTLPNLTDRDRVLLTR